MVPKRTGLSLVVAIFLLLLIAYRSPDITAAVQKGFVLDLDSPRFSFEESAFNDTKTSQEYDYGNGVGNVTYWVSIPRNSTVASASLNVTGKIVYVYQATVTDNILYGISIGNLTSYPGDEISTGSAPADPNILVLYGDNGSVIFTYNFTQSGMPGNNYFIYSTDTGNLTSYSGNETVMGGSDKNVRVLNVNDASAVEAWTYNASDTMGDVKTVVMVDIDEDGDNEVIVASNRVYALDHDGNQVWNTSINNIEYLAVGNLSSDTGFEIAVVADTTYVYVLNSTGSELWNKSMPATLTTVAVGNVTGEEYDEIAVGSSNNRI